jgi:choline dehydrogenase-like flavoprotein
MFHSLQKQGSRLLSLTLLARCALSLAVPSNTLACRADSNGTTKYDYVIVGGGLSGFVAASRLTEDKDVNVLVLEYGPIDRSNTTLVPYYATQLNIPDMFNLVTAPEPFLNGSVSPTFIGAVAGGGTTVNGMTWNLASSGDYDSWEALGNEGWNWESIQKYHKKASEYLSPPQEIVELYNYSIDASAYGEGPLKTTLPTWQPADQPLFEDAFFELNIPFIDQPAQGDATGAFWVPQSVDARTQTRCSALTCYYDLVSSRSNLKLLTEHQVTELVFAESDSDKLVVSGVKVLDRNTNNTLTFSAKKEVILAAGSIHTPHILQLSGIGPKAVVEAAGIESKLDLPAVGSNFQDHPVAYLNWTVENNFPATDEAARNATFNAEALAEYLSSRTGPYTRGQPNSIAFMSLPQISSNYADQVASISSQDPSTVLPDTYADATLQAGWLAQRSILAEQIGSGAVAVMEFPFGGSGFNPNAMQKPLSRGTVHLNPADPQGEPIVTNYALMNPFDRWSVGAFVDFTRRYFASEALSSLNPQEVSPGVEAQTAEEIIAALLPLAPFGMAPSFAHPSCSCPMMPKEKGGCVSADLLVYGVEGLSIIDSSIMPIIPAAHLQATMYAVAEKAADIIKARA